MKCIKVIVPRMLIDYYLPHPEFSGEVLVVLENGLFSDVYTDSDFNLVTSTNDRELIRYLRKNKSLKHLTSNLKCRSWNLRSLEFKDREVLFDWFNKKTDYSVNDEGYTRDIIIEYISHSLTKNSQIYIIESEDSKVGLVAYQAIYGEAIIHLEIYEKALIGQTEVKLILEKVMDYVKERYDVEIFSTTFFKEDSYSQKLFEESSFVLEDTYSLEIYDGKYKTESFYRYDIFRNIITESDLKILDDFLELANDELFDNSNSEEFKTLIKDNLLPKIGILMENDYFNLNASKEEAEAFNKKIDKLVSLIDKKMLEKNIVQTARQKEFRKILFQLLRIIDKYSKIKEKLIKKN